MVSQDLNPGAERHVSVPRYCVIYDVAPATAWRWIANGKVKVVRLGERTTRITVPAQDDAAVPAEAVRVAKRKKKSRLDDSAAKPSPAKRRAGGKGGRE